jgi:hypothetical protein
MAKDEDSRADAGLTKVGGKRLIYKITYESRT